MVCICVCSIMEMNLMTDVSGCVHDVYLCVQHGGHGADDNDVSNCVHGV